MATVLAATSTPALATRQVVTRKAISGVAGDSRSRLCICFALLFPDLTDQFLCLIVLPAQRRTVCRVSRTTMARYTSDLALGLEPSLSGAALFIHQSIFFLCSSSQQRQYQLPVAVTTGLAAAMANPLMAEAGVTPSLKNLLYSVVAGGTIAVLIVTAVTGVSNFDPTKRGSK